MPMNPYIDVVFRSVAVYLFMLLAIRLTGKKELYQLNTADVVLILLISNSVQNAMVGSDTSLQGGLIAAASLFMMNSALQKLISKTEKIRRFLNDKPEILIHNGKLDFEQLSRLSITSDELREAMREHGVEHYADIKLGMLESDGNISIISGSGTLKQTQFKRKHAHKTLGALDN